MARAHGLKVLVAVLAVFGGSCLGLRMENPNGPSNGVIPKRTIVPVNFVNGFGLNQQPMNMDDGDEPAIEFHDIKLQSVQQEVEKQQPVKASEMRSGSLFRSPFLNSRNRSRRWPAGRGGHQPRGSLPEMIRAMLLR